MSMRKWLKEKDSMQEEIIKLLLSTDRFGIEKLAKHMERMGFFQAPCSTSNHLNIPGGLAIHSMNVYNIMCQLNKSMKVDIDEESIIICALLHDLGKMGDHGKQNYVENILKSGERSESKPYITNPNFLYIPHEVRSVVIAQRYIILTEEEEHAIYYHNGKYTHTGYDLKETPLQMLLHFADLWASRFEEMKELPFE